MWSHVFRQQRKRSVVARSGRLGKTPPAVGVSPQVYWLRGKPGKGDDREYIGCTLQLPHTRAGQHASKCEGSCAKWMSCCEVYPDVTVLFQTFHEDVALMVELLAVLWRFKCTGKMPYRETGLGGGVRGACFSLPTLKDDSDPRQKPEYGGSFLSFLYKYVPQVCPPPEMYTTPPQYLPWEKVRKAMQWLHELRFQDKLPKFVIAHLCGMCFQCDSHRHYSSQCPMVCVGLSKRSVAPVQLRVDKVTAQARYIIGEELEVRPLETAAAGSAGNAQVPKRPRAPKGQGKKYVPKSRARASSVAHSSSCPFSA